MTATAASTANRRTVEIDGCSVSYLRCGEGPPLLFLHGAGGVPGWLPWMETLARSFDVIAPDHPGWGRSPTPEWFDNVHDMAYFYLDFMSALGLRDVHLAGNSIGGWIACEIAVRNTQQIATLTLISPAGLRVPGVKKFDIFLNTPEASLRAMYHDQALAEALIAQPKNDDEIDVALRNRYATARIAWQPRLYDPHLAKWLHRIDRPTLVVWGESDKILPVALCDEFVRLIPRARALRLPDCGHLPHIECTGAVVDAFTSFVEEARR